MTLFVSPVRTRIAVLFILLSIPMIVRSEEALIAKTAVHVVVTVEARHGMDAPTIARENVYVMQGRDRAEVLDWVPAQGDQAGLELFILMDDSSDFSLASQLEDLRMFIKGQPPTTLVAVGYMRNGTVETVAKFTTDHTAAAKAVRLPFGNNGGGASPYFSLQELIKEWPLNPARPRREVLMITDGIDRYNGGGPSNPYVDSTVELAQRAGILVYTIYTPGAGHYSHSSWRTNWGQNSLSQLSDETGAEAYYLGFGAPVSFVPYLDNIAHRLRSQYLLTFAAKPEMKGNMEVQGRSGRGKRRVGVCGSRFCSRITTTMKVASQSNWYPGGPEHEPRESVEEGVSTR